jgi:hypothetical protein
MTLRDRLRRNPQPPPRWKVLIANGEIVGRLVDGVYVPVGHERCAQDARTCENPDCWRPVPTPSLPWWRS